MIFHFKINIVWKYNVFECFLSRKDLRELASAPHGKMPHYGVAERGKMFYLEGNHKEALRHFQEAIQMNKVNLVSVWIKVKHQKLNLDIMFDEF